MKLTRTPILFLLAVAALVVSVPAIVSAQQGTVPPHRFAGRASIDGQAASPGVVVQAYTNGTLAATATVTTLSATGINYQLNVPQPAGSQTITFKVNGLDASQTATWQQGERDFPFPLTASSTAVPPTQEAQPTAAPTARPTVIRGQRLVREAPRARRG